MTSAQSDQRGPLAPVLEELSRITGAVESDRAARDRATIEALRKEVADLRAAVAHLRVSRRPLPASLRPAVARSLIDGADVPVERPHADA
ncbi:hypothetical protein Acsp03_02850 [Actinomadura sp. NBRC 104412]|uniref:hypothetical protein n=1 Tax=Actinomadura sp. NBRC 104412 TaxID=3032203 RepID=UPI0024A08F33|nr:hypothetical protein [Actinomadura sp. NBRC 104412]GLZ02818.1 hypothetical protein Acsp03_02850 [Actinomadura sp. NBRC 104412]